jgi:hypothetical protein
MLTSVDEPFDKLGDLGPEEMFVRLLFLIADTTSLSPSSENMKGCIEHFTSKYVVCGRLVENNAGEL